MPEIGTCDLIATKVGEPCRYEPTVQDYVFKGHAFNFVVIIADGETYEWITARGQAIKDNLVAQEKFLHQSFVKNTNYVKDKIFSVADVDDYISSIEYSAHGIKGLPPEKLLDPQLLAMPTKRSYMDLVWKNDDGSCATPVQIVINHPQDVETV